MTYKEQLEKFESTNLDLWKVVVAEEVKECIDYAYTKEYYEEICEFVYDYILSRVIDVSVVCNRLNELLYNGVISTRYFKECWELIRDSLEEYND